MNFPELLEYVISYKSEDKVWCAQSQSDMPPRSKGSWGERSVCYGSRQVQRPVHLPQRTTGWHFLGMSHLFCMSPFPMQSKAGVPVCTKPLDDMMNGAYWKKQLFLPITDNDLFRFKVRFLSHSPSLGTDEFCPSKAAFPVVHSSQEAANGTGAT